MSYKVFMIGWEFPPHIIGGLGIACQGIARSLARRGNQVKFLVPRLFGDESLENGLELFGLKEKLQILSEEEIQQLHLSRDEDPQSLAEFSGYASREYRIPRSAAELSTMRQHVSTVDLPMEGGYGDKMYAEIQRYAVFAAIMAPKLEIDLIHAHDWMTYPAGLAASQASGKPLICHVHATEFDRSGDHVNQFVYDLERHAFHACQAIITVSNYTRNILIQRYNVPESKIFPVHNGVDFEIPESVLEQTPARPMEDRIILFLGRITFQKGPDYFVRAAKIVIDRLKNVRFVMAGTGDMYHRMIELAADLGIGKYFHYTGFLNREQTKRIYSMSDLYIMPSVSEPFGISPLEAMMHGVPVIVSRQSGVSEVIANCVKVDFWNVNEIAQKIIDILLDREYTDKMRRSGHYEARNVTWDMAAGRIEEVYQKIIK